MLHCIAIYNVKASFNVRYDGTRRAVMWITRHGCSCVLIYTYYGYGYD